MKSFFTRFYRLLIAVFGAFLPKKALKTRGSASDGARVHENSPQNPLNMYQDYTPPAARVRYRKIRKHNNRKLTRGRRFYYDQTGHRVAITKI